jgi:hypothetical protein
MDPAVTSIERVLNAIDTTTVSGLRACACTFFGDLHSVVHFSGDLRSFVVF